MKKNLKILLFICIFALALITIPSTTVKAGMQANPNTHYKFTSYDLENYIRNIRNMEATGEVMGLNETINATSLLATSASNNIDVHMMKSTEYGAIGILSASGYGNPQTLQASAIKTTTGNKTGIYYSGTNYEWVAAGLAGNTFTGKDARYFNGYSTSNTSAKVGDGMGNASTTNKGTAGWHSSGASGWVVNGNGVYYFRRDGAGLFSFGAVDDRDSYGTTSSNYFRGVAAVATGL